MSRPMSPSDYPPSDSGSPIEPLAADCMPKSAKAAIGVLAVLLAAAVAFAVVLNSKLSSAHEDSANLSRSASQARADTASRERELAAAKNDLTAAKTDAQNQARANQQLITALKSCASGMYQGWLEISDDGDSDLAVRYFLQADPICKQVLANSPSNTGTGVASLNSSSRELNQ
jgi:hypothetical protein